MQNGYPYENRDENTEPEQWLKLRPWAIEALSWAIAIAFLFSLYATWVSISIWIKILRSSP